MLQYPTCTHIKEDGTYCGSPALVNRRYCYFHLNLRGRRLRRARALRDQVNYRLDLPPLEDLASAQVALSEVVQALGSGQLDQRTGGKMLYGIQQTVALMKYRAQLEAPQPLIGAPASRPASSANLGSHPARRPCPGISRLRAGIRDQSRRRCRCRDYLDSAQGR